MKTHNPTDSQFKRAAHAIIDELPDDATWQDLAEHIRIEIELEEAVSEIERRYARENEVPHTE